jgi:acetyl esterase/lipase
MPPLLVNASGAECLLDEARRLAERAESAGVEVRLSIYPEMPHVWHLSYPAFPEAVRAFDEIATFVATVAHD